MSKSEQALNELIQRETDTISELESKSVEPEYYMTKDDKPYYQYPKGEYAQHLTSINDAYWRRRNWRSQLESLKNES